MKPTLPKILRQSKKLPQRSFHYEASASYQGVSYADVLTPDGKLLEGVEVVGYSTTGMSPGSFTVMFHLSSGLEVFFHYTENFLGDPSPED